MSVPQSAINNANTALDSILAETKMIRRIVDVLDQEDKTASRLLRVSINEIDMLAKGAKQNINAEEYTYEVSTPDDVDDKIGAIKNVREVTGIGLAAAKDFVEGKKLETHKLPCVLSQENIERYAKSGVRVQRVK